MRQRVERTPDLVESILTRLAKGVPLEKICSEDGMPTTRAIRYWCKEDEEFAAQYKEARDDGFDALAAGCLDIADDGRNDYVETDDGARYNPEAVQRSKLRVWTRLELLKRWDPKRYGDLIKNQMEHSGAVGFSLTIQPRSRP